MDSKQKLLAVLKKLEVGLSIELCLECRAILQELVRGKDEETLNAVIKLPEWIEFSNRKNPSVLEFMDTPEWHQACLKADGKSPEVYEKFQADLIQPPVEPKKPQLTEAEWQGVISKYSFQGVRHGESQS